jgi:hypothetical protein
MQAIENAKLSDTATAVRKMLRSVIDEVGVARQPTAKAI